MNLLKTYQTYPKSSGLNRILGNLPKTYPTYPKLPWLTQNWPDLPKTYQAWLTWNLPDLPKTYQACPKFTRIIQTNFIVTYALTYCYNLILNEATFSLTCNLYFYAKP